MNDDVWTRPEIESPCIQLCVIHEEHGHCLGCWRTRHEIAGWSRRSPEERREIMDHLPARAEAFKPKRKGGRKKA